MGSPSAKFEWNDWQRREIHLDPADESLPENQDYSERAFHIYLLGHDAVADHHISFEALQGNWTISWKGKIALAYTGNYELKYHFATLLDKISFGGFNVPSQLNDEQAWNLFGNAVSKADEWQFVVDQNRRRFIGRVAN